MGLPHACLGYQHCAVHLPVRSTGRIRHAVKKDRQSYLLQLQHDITLFDHRDPRRLFAAVRKAFPKAASSRTASSFIPLPQVALEDGSVALTPQARAERWHSHFAEQQEAETISADRYDVLFQEQLIDAPDSTRFYCTALPTLRSIESIVLRTQKGRACGIDGVTVELLHLDVPATTRQLLPVFLKASLSTTEPTPWRGGHLLVLAKRAHATLDCSHFRSVMIYSIPAKAYHRHIRRCLVPSLRDFQCDLELGALPGVSPGSSFCWHVLFSIMAAVAKRTALIFFDIRAAYYRLIRQLVVPVEESDAAFARLLDSLQIPLAAIAELRHHLEQMAAIPQAGASAHVTVPARQACHAGLYPAWLPSWGPCCRPDLRLQPRCHDKGSGCSSSCC